MSNQPNHKNNNEFDVDAAFEDTFFHENDANTTGLEEEFSFDADDDISYDSLTGRQIETEIPNHATMDTQSNQASKTVNLVEPNLPITEPSLNTAPPPPPAPAKKSLFGKGSKKTKTTPAIKPIKTKTGEPNKLNMMILGAVIALLLLIAAFFLLKNDDVPEPVVPTVVSEPATIEKPVDEPVAIVQETPTQELPIASDVELIDVDAILQSDIPDDPALIKEEIDRLSDKEQRLAEQAQLINEQLTVMDELTTAKEEQIALLEAQIAQLEAQKPKQ